jgi:hypothetical protein
MLNKKITQWLNALVVAWPKDADSYRREKNLITLGQLLLGEKYVARKRKRRKII